MLWYMCTCGVWCKSRKASVKVKDDTTSLFVFAGAPTAELSADYEPFRHELCAALIGLTTGHYKKMEQQLNMCFSTRGWTCNCVSFFLQYKRGNSLSALVDFMPLLTKEHTYSGVRWQWCECVCVCVCGPVMWEWLMIAAARNVICGWGSWKDFLIIVWRPPFILRTENTLF